MRTAKFLTIYSIDDNQQSSSPDELTLSHKLISKNYIMTVLYIWLAIIIYIRVKNWLFFVGRRSCIGESFAKVTVFTTMTSVLQRFKLSKVKGCTYSMEPVKSLLSKPYDYKLEVIERTSDSN